MQSKQEILAGLKQAGVVAVIRVEEPSGLIEAGRALCAGGLRYIEITLTVPGALGIIEKASSALASDGVVIGAGTVLDAETARAAILAGAGYIVSPVFKPEMVDLCNRYGVVVVPGAMTPTEVLCAWEGGADIVKIFPAGVGGARFFKDLKGPLPQVDIMPTGGVNRQTVVEFIKAGACAVGVGGELIGKGLLASGDYKTITQNAKDFIELVRSARGLEGTVDL